MSNSYSMLRNPFIAMTLITSSALVVGCMDASEPESTSDSTEQLVINQSGGALVPVQGEVRFAQTSEGNILSFGSTWTQTAPGIWENSAQAGSGSLIVGAEGHRTAIAQVEKDLSALHHQAALQAGGELAIANAIQQKEAHLNTLKSAAEAMAVKGGGTTQATCSAGPVIGPSSPFTGVSGAIAAWQISCTGGCVGISVSAQATSNLGSFQNIVSSTVCAVPMLLGVAVSGTPGFGCFGTATLSPFGVTASGSFTCG